MMGSVLISGLMRNAYGAFQNTVLWLLSQVGLGGAPLGGGPWAVPTVPQGSCSAVLWILEWFGVLFI